MPNRFGLGWNISDILGGLGDAISVGAGGDANYLNQVQKDRYGAGLDQFFGGDEQGGLNSLAQAGGPSTANQFYDIYGNSVFRRASAANQAEDNRRQAQIAADKRDAATEERIAGILRGGSASDWADRLAMANQYAGARGYDITRLNIPNQYKEGWSTQLDTSLVSPKDYADDQRQGQQVEETGRHNRATEAQQDRNLRVQAALGGGRLIQQGMATDQRTNTANRASADRQAAERGRNQRAAQAEAGRNARSKNGGGQTIDGYNLRPGKRVGGTATLPSGKVVTWDGTQWK